MNILNLQLNQFLAAGYISNQNVSFPPPPYLLQIPELISVERILIFALFIFLSIPLLKKQEDPAEEKRRINLIKLAAIAGSLAMLIHFYRYLSGLN